VIPANAAAGDHFAALNVTVTAQPGQVATSGGATAQSVLVLQSRLQHRIDGARPETPTLSLTSSTTPSSVRFTARVSNAGNTVVGHQADPPPTLTLYNTMPWGDRANPERTIAVRGFYVAPKSTRDVWVDWTDLPIIGQYRAVFTLPSADGQPEAIAETTLTIVSTPRLAGISITLVLGLTLLTILAVRRRSGRRSPVARARRAGSNSAGRVSASQEVGLAFGGLALRIARATDFRDGLFGLRSPQSPGARAGFRISCR
jgi:hypothetical protein